MNVYYSKIDWWIIATIASSIMLTTVLGLFLMDQTKIGGYICIGTAILTLALFILFTFPCKYTLTKDRVLIQCGILKQEALYSQIISIKNSSNPISAPALSLQRVEIKLKTGFKIISPNNREQFIKELSSKLTRTP